MGNEKAKATAVDLAKSCNESSIVEKFHPGGTVSCGVVYQNSASDEQMKEIEAQLTQVASAT